MANNNNEQIVEVAEFSHHRLRVYWRAVKLARVVNGCRIRRTSLRRQVERAVDSVVLNIAEAAGVSGRRNKAQFLIARGSALEVVAGVELAAVYGDDVPLGEVRLLARGVIAMLSKLAR